MYKIAIADEKRESVHLRTVHRRIIDLRQNAAPDREPYTTGNGESGADAVLVAWHPVRYRSRSSECGPRLVRFWHPPFIRRFTGPLAHPLLRFETQCSLAIPT